MYSRGLAVGWIFATWGFAARDLRGRWCGVVKPSVLAILAADFARRPSRGRHDVQCGARHAEEDPLVEYSLPEIGESPRPAMDALRARAR